MHFIKSIFIKFIAAAKRSVWNYFPSVLALRYCSYVHTVVAYQSKLKKVEGLALPRRLGASQIHSYALL